MNNKGVSFFWLTLYSVPPKKVPSIEIILLL
jgi:hypothetical protein